MTLESTGYGAPPYGPADAASSGLQIGLIGCGFISAMQLAAYRDAGLSVVALCDRHIEKATSRRDEYFPDAHTFDSVEEFLAYSDVDVVDIATHVDARPVLIERALRAGKHVLSQKPFVRDLDEGERLIRVARDSGRLLAVNHNGRWAPQFSAAIAVVDRGDIGSISSVDFSVYWPHDQLFEHDPHFSVMADLVVFDFGIHWFDLVHRMLDGAGAAKTVYARARHRPGARVPVATDVEVLIEYEGAASTLLFRASAARLESGQYRIEGERGVITHTGLSLSGERVEVDGHQGQLSIDLDGDWWSRGMLGPMSELMVAADAGRVPSNDASSALGGLALAFAAKRSISTGLPVEPGTVRTANG